MAVGYYIRILILAGINVEILEFDQMNLAQDWILY